MVPELNPGEKRVEPWFKPKKGSVIPAKRRLMKRLMFDSIVQSAVSLFGFSSRSVSDCSGEMFYSEDNHLFPAQMKFQTHQNKRSPHMHGNGLISDSDHQNKRSF